VASKPTQPNPLLYVAGVIALLGAGVWGYTEYAARLAELRRRYGLENVAVPTPAASASASAEHDPAVAEKKIAEFGVKAREGKLSIEELTGGTFSISNGGVFGSMLSTPIINPPQSAILGIHATKDRAVVENGQVVVRPINYLALSYDHRIIDGREAVLGLVAMKDALEDPSRLLLDL